MTGILSLSLYPLFVTSILYFSLLTEHCATQESCGIPPTSSSTLIRMAVSGCDWSMIDTISFMSHSPFCIFCFRSLSFSLAIFASCYCVHLLGGGICVCMHVYCKWNILIMFQNTMQVHVWISNFTFWFLYILLFENCSSAIDPVCVLGVYTIRCEQITLFSLVFEECCFHLRCTNTILTLTEEKSVLCSPTFRGRWCQMHKSCLLSTEVEVWWWQHMNLYRCARLGFWPVGLCCM